MPQCDRPFVVSRVHGDHTVNLSDPLTGAAYLNGQMVSMMRLVHFNYPVEALDERFEEIVAAAPQLIAFHDMVAVELRAARRVQIARVIRVFDVGLQLEVDLYEIPTGDRYGPWAHRPWLPVGRTAVIPQAEVLCVVDLVDKALTAGSLEKLEARREFSGWKTFAWPYSRLKIGRSMFGLVAWRCG